METPQEIEVWYVLPAIRRELALSMKSHGKTQKEIARLLDVTEAAVSQYLHKKRAKELKLSKSIKSAITSSAKRIASKRDAMEHMQRLLNQANKEGVVCRLHRYKHSELKGCEACFK
jgi:hypothetical protein